MIGDLKSGFRQLRKTPAFTATAHRRARIEVEGNVALQANPVASVGACGNEDGTASRCGSLFDSPIDGRRIERLAISRGTQGSYVEDAARREGAVRAKSSAGPLVWPRQGVTNCGSDRTEPKSTFEDSAPSVAKLGYPFLSRDLRLHFPGLQGELGGTAINSEARVGPRVYCLRKPGPLASS